ncbi:MAG: hypothetical protein HOJ15_01740 [Candidatus Jacksonbacteria bacterium]|nr:hypothetical protein [Candidatus Jacksonbacteria bacterium]MBT6301129.1 hypothetical protein [Candidatus Jacksonbacteria bacterium]MBT6757288.1 hypothetical protein [Candidatus Jacksonbacteria bacterium]MBT6955631.1 hypothetical protein [Candidatus Jacksonbacteria bacterium]MBT7008424.1 hypothetical protein [Candidatus Jacksonbacteria bacterium]
MESLRRTTTALAFALAMFASVSSLAVALGGAPPPPPPETTFDTSNPPPADAVARNEIWRVTVMFDPQAADMTEAVTINVHQSPFMYKEPGFYWAHRTNDIDGTFTFTEGGEFTFDLRLSEYGLTSLFGRLSPVLTAPRALFEEIVTDGFNTITFPAGVNGFHPDVTLELGPGEYDPNVYAKLQGGGFCSALWPGYYGKHRLIWVNSSHDDHLAFDLLLVDGDDPDPVQEPDEHPEPDQGDHEVEMPTPVEPEDGYDSIFPDESEEPTAPSGGGGVAGPAEGEEYETFTTPSDESGLTAPRYDGGSGMFVDRLPVEIIVAENSPTGEIDAAEHTVVAEFEVTASDTGDVELSYFEIRGTEELSPDKVHIFSGSEPIDTVAVSSLQDGETITVVHPSELGDELPDEVVSFQVIADISEFADGETITVSAAVPAKGGYTVAAMEAMDDGIITAVPKMPMLLITAPTLTVVVDTIADNTEGEGDDLGVALGTEEEEFLVTRPLDVGLNMFHVAVDNGWTVSDLEQYLFEGLTQLVLLEAGVFQHAAEHPDLLIAGRSFAANMKSPMDLELEGTAIPVEVRLDAGINFVGAPRFGPIIQAGDWYSLSPSIQRVLSEWHGELVLANEGGGALSGLGDAFIVIASESDVLSMDGENWANLVSLAAPSLDTASVVDVEDAFRNLPDTSWSNHLQRLLLGDQRPVHTVVPAQPRLMQNYPNPFNPETWIPFELSEASDVTISVYRPNGQRVRQIDLGHHEAGEYRSRDAAAYWDGTNEIGERVSSGVYFYGIEAGQYSEMRRMVILK